MLGRLFGIGIRIIRVLRLGLESIVVLILLVLGIRVSLFFQGIRCVMVQFLVLSGAATAWANRVEYYTILWVARQREVRIGLASCCSAPLGYVKEEDLWDYLAACDVFAHPNWADFAIAPYEALALQRKVVWSNEMEKSGQVTGNRHVFPAEPTVEGLAQAALHRQADNGHRPAALRGHRSRLNGLVGPDHLHANGQHAPVRRGARGGAEPHPAPLRTEVSTREAELLRRQQIGMSLQFEQPRDLADDKVNHVVEIPAL
jgi:hypothetical protein